MEQRDDGRELRSHRDLPLLVDHERPGTQAGGDREAALLAEDHDRSGERVSQGRIGVQYRCAAQAGARPAGPGIEDVVVARPLDEEEALVVSRSRERAASQRQGGEDLVALSPWIASDA